MPESSEYLSEQSAAPRLMGDHSAHLILLLLDKGTTEQMTTFIAHTTCVCTVLSVEGKLVVVLLLADI